jgi:hypothetical protein
MFAKTIIDSDAFIDMPLSTQALYFHLSMRADDDGFINNPKKIQRMVGASDDDMKVLVMKRFIIPFESGIVVIKHWKIHNYIQKDRYKPTLYEKERRQIELKDNGAYTECIQDVSKVETQVSIGKSRDRIGKSSGSVADGYTAATTATTENVENSVEKPTDEKLEALGGMGKGVVFLTTSQFEDLLDKLGLDAFNLYVERLADFIIDKNARIKSCYDTILKWVAEDSRTKGE